MSLDLHAELVRAATHGGAGLALVWLLVMVLFIAAAARGHHR